jgi:hypothetical protein
MPEKNRTVPPVKRAAKKGGLAAKSLSNNLTSTHENAKGDFTPIRKGSVTGFDNLNV